VRAKALDWRSVAVPVPDVSDGFLEGSHPQWRRGRRDDDHVHRPEDLLADLRESRRTVPDDAIERLLQTADELADPLSGVLWLSPARDVGLALTE
jgi:hypothetical protein